MTFLMLAVFPTLQKLPSCAQCLQRELMVMPSHFLWYLTHNSHVQTSRVLVALSWTGQTWNNIHVQCFENTSCKTGPAYKDTGFNSLRPVQISTEPNLKPFSFLWPSHWPSLDCPGVGRAGLDLNRFCMGNSWMTYTAHQLLQTLLHWHTDCWPHICILQLHSC